MCTAAIFQAESFYFGRTLDYDFSYGDEIVVTPRNFPLRFLHQPALERHYALLGMAHVEGTDALYYEAVNEKGLCMAGLNFVGSAVYGELDAGRDNVAQFEFIPWVLAACANLGEAREKLARLQLLGTPYRPDLPAARLHWMLADRSGCIVVESVAEGLKIYENPVGVMTNEPPFPYQMQALSSYMHLSPCPPENRFAPRVPLNVYSRGMGAIGLPGDYSSQSRFIRAAFAAQNVQAEPGELAGVSQFFHILGAVDVPRGCCRLEDGRSALTLYTCCCDADRGIYYYNTCNNHQITAVDMRREDLERRDLIRCQPVQGEQIRMQN